MLAHLVGNQFREAAVASMRGDNQLPHRGWWSLFSHDAAALNVLLSSSMGLFDALIALLLSGSLLILGAQVLGVIPIRRFRRVRASSHAGELIDGPPLRSPGRRLAVNLRAGRSKCAAYRGLPPSPHRYAAGFTNRVRDGCGNVVNGGVFALSLE